VDAILEALTTTYKNEQISTIDGVKIDFATEWVHLRKSNTEPIIRIYTEAPTQNEADVLAERFVKELKVIAGI
jgi:phosphomannomutase